MVAACATLALTAGAATAQTVPPDRTTYVTFSGPVSIPGMTLPAGTYTFRIANSNTDRHIVQIFNREGTKLMTTLLAVPAQRLEPTGDPIITFKETRSDQPPAVHYWYYAGDLAGNELVYPKNQAQMIANASGEPVMGVDSDSGSIDDWKSGSVSRVTPDNAAANTSASTTSSSASTTSDTSAQHQTSASQTAQPTTTSDQAAQPTTAQSTTTTQPTTTADQSAPSAASQPTTTSQPTTAADQTSRPSPAPAAAPSTTDTNQTVGTSGRTEGRLPKTASELPMVGLIGLLALGGAVAVRAARTV